MYLRMILSLFVDLAKRRRRLLSSRYLRISVRISLGSQRSKGSHFHKLHCGSCSTEDNKDFMPIDSQSSAIDC